MSDSQTDRLPSDGETVLRVRDTSVAFEMARGESRVLDSVDLDIYKNEVLAIVGESGSGKSMFASSLLDAVVSPGKLRGSITYQQPTGDDVDVLSLDERELRDIRWKELSMVFQGAMSSFNPTIKMRKHFVETLQAHDQDVDDGLDRAHELLSDLYLDPDRVLDSYPHELSGGMKQRTLIALSMLLEPQVLVMDEPTASLDLLMQRSILSLLQEIKRKYDLTLIFITHDLPLVAELADRIAVMYAFEFVEIAPTEEILAHAAHPYTRALLNATPNLSTDIDKMQTIDGESPDPVNVPEGCSYHPRCPLARDTCLEDDPPFYDVDESHVSACHFWEETTRSVPLTIADDADVEPDVVADTASSEPETTVLSLDDVEVHYDVDNSLLESFSEETQVVKAVDGVSFDLGENQVLALVGESGCGKTTLGKTAIGLEEPTGGSVRYRGQDIWEAKRKRGSAEIPYPEIRRALQIIHQDPGSSLNPNRRVLKTLAEPLKRWHKHLSAEDRRARIYGMLEMVGMAPPDDYARRYPHQLSGGEKQRVALVRALLMNPDVILADEAVSALDVSLRVEMMDLLIDLQEQFNTSFIFISHDLSNARYLAERADGLIGVMYLGKLVEIGTPAQIIHDPRHPYTKALRWATPNLSRDVAIDELPMRRIDIPDPINPPSGCRYHTRCPEAREACTEQSPELIAPGQSGQRGVACFREYEEHEYWDSEELSGNDGSNESA